MRMTGENLEDRHWQEREDRRSFYLRLRPRLWILPAAAAAGALVCFLIYTLVIVTVHGQRQYTETSVYEVNFAQNEETGKAYDYYNAATWQGLLFSHPDLTATIRAELPTGMTMEMAQNDTRADLVSDIRYLSVEVTTPSEQDTAQLSLAIRDALEHFGETAKEFDSIAFLSATEPTLVVVSDRSRNALLLGLVLGLLIAAFAVWYRVLLDDAVYVPEEAERRYSLPVLGVLPASGDERHRHRAELPAMLRRQLPLNLTAALRGKDRVLVMSMQGTEDARRILGILGNALADAGARDLGLREPAKGSVDDGTGQNAEGADIRCGFVPCGPVDGPSADAAAGTCRDVIVIVHFGGERGSRTENYLQELRKLDYRIAGLLLTDADGRFLNEYYGA